MFFSRSLVHAFTSFLLAMVFVLSGCAPVQAEEHELLVTWDDPSPSLSGLERMAGDTDNWTFTVKLEENLEWVRGPVWQYPKNGADEDWGAFSGGADGDGSLSWSSPLSGGSFRVGVTGRIRRTGGGGGGGGGAAQEKDVNADWSGKITEVWDWKPEPTLPSGTVAAWGGRVVGAGQRVALSVVGVNTLNDSDTRTNLAGKTETKSDGLLKYKWGAGSKGQMSAIGPFANWTAPTNVPPAGLTVTITCTIDDKHEGEATGVDEPDTGTRNDAPVVLTPITITVLPYICGQYKHESWTPASEVVWTIDARGYPQPQTPTITENAKWEDSCAATTKPPIADQRLYSPAQGANDIEIFENGILYREVSYSAQSWYGGPNAPILKSRRPLNRTWSANPPISGGEIVAVTPGTILKPGETYTFAVSQATDKDTWTRNGVSREELDEVRYTWSSSSGSIAGNGTMATWTAPAEADVPAGAGLTVTVTCVIDDIWDGEATGVADKPGESGTRNDGAAPTQTATIQVQRAPCGRWQHKSWKASTLTWRTDSNGDPEPVTPADATEVVQWVDECGTTTKPDEERSVPYTLVSDAPIQIEGAWNRRAEYRAYSTCAGGAASELLSGERPLPRHWSVPGELDGGSMSIQFTGAETTGLTSPGTVTPASTTALILPVNGGVSLNISGAKDGDTYSYWNVPEEEADDTMRYKWTVTNEAGATSEPVTGSAFGWSGAAPGTYVITGTVDDASGLDENGNAESGVELPDLGERNDEDVAYLVAVTIVGKEWDAATSIGQKIIFNEDGSPKEGPDGEIETKETGRLLAPQDQRNSDAAQWKPQPIYVRPGQSLDLAIEKAFDFDHWKQELSGSGARNKPPYQDWVTDEVRYKWSVSGPVANGPTGELTGDTGTSATWTAPAAQPGVEIVGTYTIECILSDPWEGEATGVTPPGETGTRNDGDLVRTVEVIVRESESFAALKVLPSNAAGAPLDAEKKGAVGGTLWGQLEVTVGINQKLDATLTGVVARVEETDEIHEGQTSPLPYFETPISFTQGWEHFRDRDENGALLPEAQWQWVDGGIATEVKDYEVKYRTRFSWNSTTQPLGHNGEHLVSLMKAGENVQLRFVKINGDTYESGPSSRNVDVQNLLIDEVSTNVNEDYFIFDQTSADSSRVQPEITFRIKDEGDPHRYEWTVYIEPTTQTQPLASIAFISGVATSSEIEQPIVVPWNGRAGDGSAEQPFLPRGSYTFDIWVREVKDDNNGGFVGVDFEAFKSELLDMSQHTVEWVDTAFDDEDSSNDDEAPIKARISYQIVDKGNKDASDVKVFLLNQEFVPVATYAGENQLMAGRKNAHFYEKIDIHTLAEDDEEGIWRGVFTAVDDHATEYRSHENKRMWAVNQAAGNWKLHIMIDPGHGRFMSNGTLGWRRTGVWSGWRGNGANIQHASPPPSQEWQKLHEDDSNLAMANALAARLSDTAKKRSIYQFRRTRTGAADVSASLYDSIGLRKSGMEDWFEDLKRQGNYEKAKRTPHLIFVSLHTNALTDTDHTTNGTQSLYRSSFGHSSTSRLLAEKIHARMIASTTEPGAYGSGRVDKKVIDMQLRPPEERPGVLGDGSKHIPRVIVESVFHTNTSLGGNPPGGKTEFSLLRDGLNWTNGINGSVTYDRSTTDGDGAWWGFERASQSIRYGINDYYFAQKTAP